MELVIASVLLGALAGYTIAEGVVSLVSYINRKRRRFHYTCTEFIPLEQDQKVIDRIRDCIRSHYRNDIAGVLLEMNGDERQEALRNLARDVAECMEIEEPEVVFQTSSEMGMGRQGAYRFLENKLYINIDYVLINDRDVLLDAADTVIHEMSHAYQDHKIEELLEMMSRGEDPELTDENMRTAEWMANMQDYVTFDVDPAGYRYQPLELFAFGMAGMITAEFREVKG